MFYDSWYLRQWPQPPALEQGLAEKKNMFIRNPLNALINSIKITTKTKAQEVSAGLSLEMFALWFCFLCQSAALAATCKGLKWTDWTGLERSWDSSGWLATVCQSTDLQAKRAAEQWELRFSELSDPYPCFCWREECWISRLCPQKSKTIRVSSFNSRASDPESLDTEAKSLPHRS